MRVIAGKAKSRRLTVPKGLRVRPTSDRVKESLFNIISDRLDNAKVLDLYAGCGALSIEALSRGAQSSVLVDSNTEAVRSIRKNLEHTGFANVADVRRIEVLRALDLIIKEGKRFNLIFLDPPYNIIELDIQMVLSKASKCLQDGGIVIFEHGLSFKDLQSVKGLSLMDKRKYGQTAISIFERKSNDS